MKKKLRGLLFPLLILLIATSNVAEVKYSKVNSTAHFKTGDIILRESKGILGNLFRSFSLKQKLYSHAGIIMIQNDSCFVLHFIDNGRKGITREYLPSFTNKEECYSYAVFRNSTGDRINNKLSKIIIDKKWNSCSFDSDFDLKSDNELYCTEWVYKCYEDAGVIFPLTTINGVTYVAPDNLYINNFVQPVCHVKYND